MKANEEWIYIALPFVMSTPSEDECSASCSCRFDPWKAAAVHTGLVLAGLDYSTDLNVKEKAEIYFPY
jgi:hypothetical protein